MCIFVKIHCENDMEWVGFVSYLVRAISLVMLSTKKLMKSLFIKNYFSEMVVNIDHEFTQISEKVRYVDLKNYAWFLYILYRNELNVLPRNKLGVI